MKTLLAASRRLRVSPLLGVCLLMPAMTFAEPAGAHPHQGQEHRHARSAMHDDLMMHHHGRDRDARRTVRVSSHGSKHRGQFNARYLRVHHDAMAFLNHILKFKDGMSLTDTQARQLLRLKTHYLKSRVTMKAKMQLAGLDLSALMQDEHARLATIEAQVHAIHAMKEKMDLAAIKVKHRARALLSAEQKIRMKTIHERIKKHGGRMMHRQRS